MSSQPVCKKCGSFYVYWSFEDEVFICNQCNEFFFDDQYAEEHRYALNPVDFQLTEIPGWVFRKKDLKKIDLSSEPYDSFHADICNRITAVSSEIGLLTNLEDLDLTYNNISELPPEIGKCKELRYLSFAQNQVKKIPPEIENLKKLEILNLHHNCIESLPTQIGGLISLKGLHIDNNKISYLPKEIGMLKNLKILRAEHNRIEELPPGICLLKNLETLQLHDNRIEALPDNIGLLSNLKTLNLNNNSLKTLPKSIVNMVNLEKFSISGNLKLTSPPYQVAVQGLTAIKDWFDQPHNNIFKSSKTMKALDNLKSHFKRKKKHQKEIPTEKALDEDDSKENLPTDSQKTQPEFNDKESQIILEEWKNGKIICDKWNAFQDDDARLK